MTGAALLSVSDHHEQPFIYSPQYQPWHLGSRSLNFLPHALPQPPMTDVPPNMLPLSASHRPLLLLPACALSRLRDKGGCACAVAALSIDRHPSARCPCPPACLPACPQTLRA